jgi:transposase
MIGLLKIRLTPAQRADLERMIARPTEAAGLVRRAHVLLLSDAGVQAVEIAKRLALSPAAVSRIRRRFIDGGVAALSDRRRPGRPPELVKDEQIVQLAMSPPPAGRVRWTVRLLSKRLKVGHATVARILRKRGLKPHLVRTYKVSRDPAFVEKVEDVVGLYLNPPEQAVVLSVDEKTSIQALERTQIPLPMRPGRAARHTHDYKRHGVVDLYAALEVATGKVTHDVRDSHTAADFLSFMKKVVRRYPKRELHVILDNSSTHSTPAVTAWLAAHPLVHFHYTPTSASWLNQVEGFFGILGKQSLAVTHFPSKKALRDHLAAFMDQWNRNPTPFQWTKPAAAIIKSRKRMLDRISGTVH